MSYGQISYGELSYGEELDSGIQENIADEITVAETLSVNWTSNPVLTLTFTVDDSLLSQRNANESVSEDAEVSDTEVGLITVPAAESINTTSTLLSSLEGYSIQSDTMIVLDMFGTLDVILENLEVDTAHAFPIFANAFDFFNLSGSLYVQLYDLLIDILTTSDILEYKILGEIIEAFTTSDTLLSQGDFKVFVVDNLENNDRLIIGLPTTITDFLELNDTPAGIRKQLVTILNNLVVDGTLTSVGSFIVNQSEVFNILDVIGTDAFEALISSLTSSDDLSVRMVASMALTGSMALSEALSQSVEAFLEAVSDLALNDLNSTQSNTVVSVAENINISHLFDPVNMRSWVINPENYAVYNYTFGFTQTARFGNSYLMANDTGLYELGGTTDAGETITSVITTSALDFGTESIKQVPAVLLGTNGTDFILKVSIDGKTTARYQINCLPDELGTKRIKIGKGLIGKNWQFTLITDNNSEFDLDSFEFFPIAFKRKHNG